MSIPPIVCFSGIDWDFLWQRHQILMSDFAARGVSVLFLENMGLRSPGTRDIGRVKQRVVRLYRQALNGARREGPITIVSPFVLPLESKWAWWANISLFLPLISRQIRQLGFVNPVVWTYTPSRMAEHLASLLEPVLRVYDCVMNIKGYAYATPQLVRSEREWSRRSDLVLTDAQTLFSEKQALNPHTYRLPPGVDFERFAPYGQVAEPTELHSIPRPRLCFFGTLGWWVDYELLHDFAAAHRDWSIVLIGPIKAEVSPINNLQNVWFLGTKAHDRLSQYLRHIDVLCIPYLVNEFTDGVLPSKLYESMATGKPIVSTPIAELKALDGLIKVVDRHEFSKAVLDVYRSDSPEQADARIRVAYRNSWKSRSDQAFELLKESLKRKDIPTEDDA